MNNESLEYARAINAAAEARFIDRLFLPLVGVAVVASLIIAVL